MTVAVQTRREALQRMTVRSRELLTRLNLYYAAVGILVLVNLYLLLHIFVTWRAADSQNSDALNRQTVSIKPAEIEKKPLEGLDGKLTAATADSDRFYEKRLP